LRNFSTNSLGSAKKPVGESEMVRLRNGGGGEDDVVVVAETKEGYRWEKPHREHKTLPKKNPEGQDQ
jgi:hypothetical protein